MKSIEYDPTQADELDLRDLRGGIGSGISPAVGSAYAEAAGIALERNDHASGTSMLVQGDASHELAVHWEIEGDSENARRAWGDPDVTAEWGAYGVACLLVEGATECTIAERSRKGTGFDFWLRHKSAQGMLFQDAAKLEVSGISRGNERAVKKRVRAKEEQVQRYDTSRPAMVAVVEFGRPLLCVTTYATR